MILYFSGTGNSAYTARSIGEAVQDEVVDLFERIRERDFSELTSERPWVIVSPVYAWRLPRILEEWLKGTNLKGSREIYFVITCGSDIGNAGAYCEKLCVVKRWTYRGCAEIIMPENYIALFRAPEREEALQIIERAEEKISETAQCIAEGKDLPIRKIGLKDKLTSGIVNDIFYPIFVHSKKFSVTDRCISCGLCEKLCPMNNIRITDGRPVWKDDCTHCMACICRCPSEAVEYGRHTVGQVRYICPK